MRPKIKIFVNDWQDGHLIGLLFIADTSLVIEGVNIIQNDTKVEGNNNPWL